MARDFNAYLEGNIYANLTDIVLCELIIIQFLLTIDNNEYFSSIYTGLDF